MQRVLELIEKRIKKDMETHPWISWLNSDKLPVEERLRLWSNALTVFAMCFKDFCNIILVYPTSEAKEDSLKAAINEHAKEDGTHWKFMMRDLKTLGQNKDMDVVSVLKFFYGKDMEEQRKAFYELIVLAEKAKHPLLRFCLISTFEKCGYTVFKVATSLGIQYEAETGRKMYYLGKTHLEHEEGHLQCSPTTLDQDELWNEELSPEMFKLATEIVGEVFQISFRLCNCYLKFVKSGKGW